MFSPIPVPEEIAQELGLVGSRLGPIASHVAWYATVSSTNDIAAGLAERGADEGYVVAADAQTAGRGRQGREWVSPAGAGLYVSAILRPAPKVAPLITIAAGVAIAEGIQAATGLAARVKWPNDVHIGPGGSEIGNGRKVAGILAEAGFSGGEPSHVVLGFGINVLPAAYPASVAARATSIESELGREVNRGLLLAECLAALWARYVALREGASSAVLAEWRRRATATFGRPVEWHDGTRTQRGTAEDIDDDGALLVRTNGGTARVTSGEVRWVE